MNASSNKQLALEAMNAFFDGRMSESELAHMLVIAAEENCIDDDERHLLTSIVSKLNRRQMECAGNSTPPDPGLCRH